MTEPKIFYVEFSKDHKIQTIRMQADSFDACIRTFLSSYSNCMVINIREATNESSN